MNPHIAIESLKQKYRHDPATAACLKDCLSVLTGILDEILNLTAKIQARSARRGAAPTAEEN